MSLLTAWYQRFWYLANREKMIGYVRDWQRKHPEVGRASSRRYSKTEKGKAARIRYRRSPKGRATIKHLNKIHQWHPSRQRRLRGLVKGSQAKIVAIYKRAAELRQWFNVVVDHKLPISKGGKHAPNNLQIIYAHENARKHNNPNYRPVVIFS